MCTTHTKLIVYGFSAVVLSWKNSPGLYSVALVAVPWIVKYRSIWGFGKRVSTSKFVTVAGTVNEKVVWELAIRAKAVGLGAIAVFVPADISHTINRPA